MNKDIWFKWSPTEESQIAMATEKKSHAIQKESKELQEPYIAERGFKLTQILRRLMQFFHGMLWYMVVLNHISEFIFHFAHMEKLQKSPTLADSFITVFENAKKNRNF
jgi:hypothetical protein